MEQLETGYRRPLKPRVSLQSNPLIEQRGFNSKLIASMTVHRANTIFLTEDRIDILSKSGVIWCKSVTKSDNQDINGKGMFSRDNLLWNLV